MDGVDNLLGIEMQVNTRHNKRRLLYRIGLQNEDLAAGWHRLAGLAAYRCALAREVFHRIERKQDTPGRTAIQQNRPMVFTVTHAVRRG